MKHTFLFWILVLISLSNQSNASGREAGYKADDIVNDLQYGRPVRSKAVEEMFNNLKAIAVTHETKSDGSKESASTTSSSSSEGFIKGIEFIIGDAFPGRSGEANIVDFISLLRAFASTMDPEVFQQGVMLISGKLGC